MKTAYYTRCPKRPNVFHSTHWTAGPWSPKLQHGGPPAALLTKAVQEVATTLNCPLVTRVTFMFFKPIPLIPLKVNVETLRKGKNASHVQASLLEADNEDNELFRAVALCTRDDDFSAHVPASPPAHQPKLESIPHHTTGDKRRIPTVSKHGFTDSLDTFTVEGEQGNGPTKTWCRSNVALVDGEPTSPQERVLMMADSAGGLSFYVDFSKVSFLNADMTVNFLRPKDIAFDDGYVGMDTRVELSPDHGVGLARATMHDAKGPCAFVTHSQVLQSRL